MEEGKGQSTNRRVGLTLFGLALVVASIVTVPVEPWLHNWSVADLRWYWIGDPTRHVLTTAVPYYVAQMALAAIVAIYLTRKDLTRPERARSLMPSVALSGACAVLFLAGVLWPDLKLASANDVLVFIALLPWVLIVSRDLLSKNKVEE